LDKMGDKSGASPVVRRRRLRSELRAARQKAGLTQDQVAAALDWSQSKVIRIEAGSVGISTTNLKALLSLYGINDQELIDKLVALGKAAKERGWWSSYRDVLSTAKGHELLQLVEYESAAAITRNFEPLLVPGLLQTEEYARAVIPEYAPHDSVEALVEIRMKRQQLMARPDGPLLFFVLDEAVVHRLVGGKDVMRRQLSKLIELGRNPRVTIEIVPFSSGAHPGLLGPFAVLEFPDPEDGYLLCLENIWGDLIKTEESDQVQPYLEAFEQLRRMSLGPEGSAEYLRQVAGRMH
jgi:transcriptional regulator with XRE-family HTH domain